jgi:hypothetical protein
MFFPNSRYADAATYTARTASGREVTAARLPVRSQPAVRGLHQRADTQRLDLIAAHYVGDPTAFWRLCDAADAIAPDALAARDLVAIPESSGGKAR